MADLPTLPKREVLLPHRLGDDLLADWLTIDSAFTEVARNEFWVLHERDRNVALPG